MVDLDFMRDRLRRGSEQRIRRAAPVLEQQLRREVPVAEDGGGAMRDSISVDARGLRVDVLVDVDYASYVIEGTPQHPIEPKRTGGLLAFEWDVIGGLAIFAKVMHPGTTANDWYHPVLDDWSNILERTPV